MALKPCVLAIVAAAGSLGFAQGGPPLVTDDTETVPKGKWEVNLAWAAERSAGAWLHEGPIFDFNRGVSDRVHVNFEVPWVWLSDGGLESNGVGNGAVGSKIRFVDAHGGLPAVSIHPAIEFGISSRSSRLGLTESETSVFLPVALQWECGVNAEVGLTLAPGSSPGWAAGLAFGRDVAGSELLAEVHGEGLAETGESVWIAQVGLRHDFSESQTLLFAFGRSFASHGAEPIDWTSYLALQLKF